MLCLIPLSQPSQKAGSLTGAEGRKGVWQSFPLRGSDGELTRKIQSCRRRQEEPSTVGGELGLNVHSADGAFPAGGQPLVHARLVEEVHAR